MKTICVQIGNSDDKLSQTDWAMFVSELYDYIGIKANRVWFSGWSNPAHTWQNFAIIFEMYPSDEIDLKKFLYNLKKQYKQDSIAWSELSQVEFI